MKRKKVESSNLASVGYSARRKLLEIQFKGKDDAPGPVYQYKDVPPEVAKGLEQADSKGKYVWKNIRGVYTFEKVEG